MFSERVVAQTDANVLSISAVIENMNKLQDNMDTYGQAIGKMKAQVDDLMVDYRIRNSSAKPQKQ